MQFTSAVLMMLILGAPEAHSRKYFTLSIMDMIINMAPDSDGVFFNWRSYC